METAAIYHIPPHYRGASTSIISSFFGIYVRMYFDDHAPPHIHAEYQGHEALIAIADGTLLDGGLPKRAHALVQQWCLEHADTLARNWRQAQALQPLSRIPGADND